MADLESQKKFILEQLGEEGFKILSGSGINVDLAITKVLQAQNIRQKGLEALADSGDVVNIATSELAYKSSSLNDVYGQEFTRRLKGIDLTDKQVCNLYQTEQLILSADSKLTEERKQPWVRRYFIMHNSTPENIPEKGFLTLSELIFITDDANSAFFRDHGVLPDKAWSALCIAACCANYTEARYALGFNERTEKFGWSKAQSSAFTKNECLLTERLKWGHHNNPAWTPETSELGQYTQK
jgi:hypothetical protein